MSREKIALVTGAAGFVGSHLSERLVREGWTVRGIDCFSDYYDPTIKRANLAQLAADPRFELIESDLREMDLDAVLQDVDVVWHLAAQAGVRSSWGQDFSIYTSVNILATQRLLEACRGSSLSRLVYASSSSIYGEAERFPVRETDRAQPISPYGVSKLAGEHLSSLYHRNYGLPTVALRYFTVYGPRQRPDMGFHRFFRAVLRGKPVTVYGDGKQTRDFTYVGDITEANLRAGSEGPDGAVYNVSGGSRVTVLEVLHSIEQVTGREAVREFSPKQHGDPLDTGGDSSLAAEHLGYRPQTDLSTGLAAMGDWIAGAYEEGTIR